jgi:hypothetical protein
MGGFCNMFRTNDTHLQEDLFNHYRTMKPSIAKMLEKSWAPVFYEEVFCKIDETIFAPLYCLDNGRPNTPVNILLSLEIIKHQFGFTDEEILEQFYFNFQVLYALGIKNLGEIYIAERTIYEFRERIYSYILERPDQEDILFKQFEILTNNFIKKAGTKTNEQRMDSTLISPNIKKAGRLSLAHDVLHQAVKIIPKHLLSDTLKPVLENYFKNDLLYKTRNTELDSRLQKVLDLMTEVAELNQIFPELYAQEEMTILRRFLTEQASFDQEAGKLFVKASKEIKSNSLQSAYDQDATFRHKAGKNHSGYVLNLTETCSPENEVQFITDYKLEPNNKSDIEIAQNRLPGIKQKTNVTNLYADGGYYGEDIINQSEELGVKIHFTDMTGKKESTDKLPLTSFTFNEEYEIESCLNGKKPTRSVGDTIKKVSSSHFSREDCQGCPHYNNCPVKTQKKNRVLRISFKSIVAAQTREEINKKEIKRQNHSRRAAIEGTNSALKRGEDMNKLNVRGYIKSHMACSYKIMARNIKQFVRLVKSVPNRLPRPDMGELCPNAS